MKTLNTIGILLFLGFTNNIWAAEGSGSHGGGGVVRNGQYLTFADANFTVGLKPMEDVPGLQKLQTTIMSLPLEDRALGELSTKIINTGERRYYSITGADLNPQKRAQIVAIYEKLLGSQNVNQTNAVIYALTCGLETYLLPEFFQLPETEQASILFHEALWATDSTLSYDFVVDAEIKFQRYLEKGGTGYDVALFPIFDELLKADSGDGSMVPDYSVSLKAAFASDLESGALNSLLVPKTTMLRLSDIFPMDDTCSHGGNGIHFGNWGDISNVDSNLLAAKVAKLMIKYPQSNGLKRLFQLSRKKFIFMMADNDYDTFEQIIAHNAPLILHNAMIDLKRGENPDSSTFKLIFKHNGSQFNFDGALGIDQSPNRPR